VLGTEFQDMLRCIRCGACLNHCPVYNAVGGHAYGWVYPGPIGSVVTPALIGIENAKHLPNASTFCGRCEEVCPMRIPIPKMLRHWREKDFERHLQPTSMRWGLGLWAWMAKRPKLYRKATALAARVLANQAFGKGRLKKVPLASGWTEFRDMPAPQGKTFHQLWKERRS
jgi:L-lactate dehydrogenase complex protein LldF